MTPIETRTSASKSSQPGVPGAPTNPVTTFLPGTTVHSHITRSQGIIEYSLPKTGSLSNTEDMRFNRSGNLFFENDATGQIGELILRDNDDPPTIKEWAIPQGKGFYNIEFDARGTTLWISDTAGFNTGGAVYKFTFE